MSNDQKDRIVQVGEKPFKALKVQGWWEVRGPHFFMSIDNRGAENQYYAESYADKMNWAYELGRSEQPKDEPHPESSFGHFVEAFREGMKSDVEPLSEKQVEMVMEVAKNWINEHDLLPPRYGGGYLAEDLRSRLLDLSTTR